MDINKAIVDAVRCTWAPLSPRTARDILSARYFVLYGRNQARTANFNVLGAGDVTRNVLPSLAARG